jgi:pyruvate kinase
LFREPLLRHFANFSYLLHIIFCQPAAPTKVLTTIAMANALDHLNAGRTRVEWLSQLNTEYQPARNYRRTSIICTIGPKTNSVEKINELRKCGLNIVRMNFSHGSYEYHQSVIDNARNSEKAYAGRPIAIALDTKGPEIRTGNTPDDKDIPIKAGHELNITTDEKYKTASDDSNMYVDYANITKVIEKGRIIYVDDGVLSFQVLDVVDDKTIRVKAVNNGNIASRKGVNLPKTDVDLPPLSEKDKADLRFGVKNKVDMVFASFIRQASDITAIREVLGEDGKDVQIIAKIENQQGVNNFDEILKLTDGVMVARGDLGIEIPPAHVFIAQKMMITKCNLAGKPVICATQMLESMTYNPRPTRAEVSDVGNAVLDGADCVMLSGETAKGNYPNEAVTMMHETCLLAEVAIPYISQFDELRRVAATPVHTPETVAMAAVSASLEQAAGAIAVLTTSGSTARLISKYRPVCPIIMITRNDRASRYSHLYRGVYPFLFPEEKPDFAEVPWQEDVDRRLKWGIMNSIKLGILKQGDAVVCVQGWRGGMGHTNTLRVVEASVDLGLTGE